MTRAAPPLPTAETATRPNTEFVQTITLTDARLLQHHLESREVLQ